MVGILSAVHPSTDHAAYLDYLRRPEVAVVTITVTEAGYVRSPDGHLDLGREPVVTDVAAYRTALGCATAVAAWVLHLRGHGAPVKDPGAGPARRPPARTIPRPRYPVCSTRSPSGLSADRALVEAIVSQMDAVTAS